MTQYKTLAVKLSNSQLHVLKSAIKKWNWSNLSTNLIGNSNEETSFPDTLLLTDTQVSKIHKTKANGSSTNTKFPKTPWSKIAQLGRFLFSLPSILCSPIKEIISPENSIKNLFGKEFKNIGHKELDSKFLLDIGLNLNGKKWISSITVSGITLTNNEIKDTLKIIKSLENRRILVKGTTTKITSNEGGVLDFLRLLMTAGLLLMKSVLTPLKVSPLSAAMSAIDAAIQKIFMDQELQH